MYDLGLNHKKTEIEAYDISVRVPEVKGHLRPISEYFVDHTNLRAGVWSNGLHIGSNSILISKDKLNKPYFMLVSSLYIFEEGMPFRYTFI